MLAFIPLFTLGAYWAAGVNALIAVAIIFPLMLAAMRQMGAEHFSGERDGLTGLMLREGLIDWLEWRMVKASRTNSHPSVVMISIDGLDALEERFGRMMRTTVLQEAADRLNGFVRQDDVVARIGDGFAVGLANVREPETENLLQLSRRMQAIFDDPVSEGPTRTYITISLGVTADSHVKNLTAANLVAAAQRASELAALSGSGSIRVYSEGLSSKAVQNRDAARDLTTALETGEIYAWFQPQVKTRGGGVTGFEALARWETPERGLVSPASFLPDIEKAGLSQRLSEVMLKQALLALNAWDAAGFDVPTVSVNFSNDDLRNPRLPDYVRWELDRHNLSPGRLVIEVLESVVAESSEDVISRTLQSLSQIGCLIDLDDFGTGFTCLMNVHRFNVNRIKLDRCLVRHVDKEDQPLKMVSALLAFAENLDIEVLAEGVETTEEVECLAELGCDLMQGYVAARPMPLGDTLNWLESRTELPHPQQPVVRMAHGG
ncbi:MAG: phosphodiesterase [Silicimonas sp.]|nr:phosphodiesterase [Silicimonas sp.]